MTTPQNNISIKGLSVWLVCAVFYMYEFLLRTVLGTFQNPLIIDLNLTPVEFALISSTAYQLIYGFMQIPVGIITDRLGLKNALLGAVIICTIASIGFSMSHHFASAISFRLLMGLGSSFGFVCLLIAVYDWLPRKNIALFIGISQFIGTVGPMSAAGPLSMLSTHSTVSWREVFLVLGGVGSIIAVLVLLFVDKNRERRGKFIVLSRPTRFIDNLKRLTSQRQVWIIAVFCAMSYFSIEYLSENEGVSFLATKGFSSSFASFMITLAWLGYALGCPILGFISDKFQRRKPVIVIAACSSFIALLGIIYLPLNYFFTGLCFLMLGLGASGQSVGIALIAEQCKEGYLALGLGLNNAMIMTLSATAAPIIGGLLSRYSHPVQLAGYQQVFATIMSLAIFALLLSIFGIKETFGKSMRENTLAMPAAYLKH